MLCLHRVFPGPGRLVVSPSPSPSASHPSCARPRMRMHAHHVVDINVMVPCSPARVAAPHVHPHHLSAILRLPCALIRNNRALPARIPAAPCRSIPRAAVYPGNRQKRAASAQDSAGPDMSRNTSGLPLVQPCRLHCGSNPYSPLPFCFRIASGIL